jgi:peptide-methionine (S)-S-oxide reductase
MSKIKELPTCDQVLPGRPEALALNFNHTVLNVDMREVPENAQSIWLGLGCFWGAERLFWELRGVITTAVGYAGGTTPNPTYEEVCSGYTGHTEIVQVVFDPAKVSLTQILKVFWEAHDPTQCMRQGNDIGTQYRSAIYHTAAQESDVFESKSAFQAQLNETGLGSITTEIRKAPVFYYAEQYHQQYLHKNPNGYCGLKGTGVVCPI